MYTNILLIEYVQVTECIIQNDYVLIHDFLIDFLVI